MPTEHPLTDEQIRSNIEVRTFMGIIKGSYPWVTGFYIPKDVNQYNLIFLDFYIDDDKFQEWIGRPVNYRPWVQRNLESDGFFVGSSLDMIYELKDDVAAQVNKRFEKVSQSLQNTKVIPKEHKLPVNRRISLNAFILTSKKWKTKHQ